MSRAELERRRALRPEMSVIDYVPPEDFNWEYCENSISIRGNVLDIFIILNGVEVQNEFHIRSLKFTDDHLGFETVDSYSGAISIGGRDHKHLVLDFGNEESVDPTRRQISTTFSLISDGFYESLKNKFTEESLTMPRRQMEGASFKKREHALAAFASMGRAAGAGANTRRARRTHRRHQRRRKTRRHH